LAAAPADQGVRVGVDPVDRLSLMENHDHAYHIWCEAAVRQRVLVHIDAHHDMWWIKDNAALNIANFICPALREDIVKKVFWVVPDRTWETRSRRRAVIRHLREITKSYPGGRQAIRVGNHQVSTTILGKPLIACALDSLPQFDETVLLDIDTDFLVIPHVSYHEAETQGEFPWCWPDRLLAQLRTRNLRSDLVTIVYSVEGGYTPLEWKYLGDEVRFRLTRPAATHELKGFEQMRAAALARARGDWAAAEQHYRQAIDVAADWAAPCYHLAYLLAKTAQTDEARLFYRCALSFDPSYRTPYGSPGVSRYNRGQYREAEAGFRQTLSLDPQNAHAHLGLGRIARRRKQWAEAEAELRAALSLDSDLLDAHRHLGEVLVKQGRRQEAIRSYERSLKLALAGHRPLDGHIVTEPGRDRLGDLGHCRTHAVLANLYARQGNARTAIACYRLALGGGYDGFLLRLRLARAYLKQGRWRAATIEAWHALKRAPSSFAGAVRHLRRRISRLGPRGLYRRMMDFLPFRGVVRNPALPRSL